MNSIARLLQRTFAALALAGAAQASTAAQPDLLLAISEGSSGGLDHARVIAKYQGLAQQLTLALKRNVNVVFVREFSALEEGLKQRRYDLLMARPSDYPARGIRDYGYQYVASSLPQGRCLVIVGQSSSIKTLEQVKTKKIVLPDPVAYMSRFCAAELRDRGINLGAERIERVKEQSAVPFYLNHGFGDVGAIASYSAAAAKLEQSGHRIIHQSVPQPYFPIVAKNEFSATQIAAMQQQLGQLATTPQGQKVLSLIGIEGFDTTSKERLQRLLTWLEQPGPSHVKQQ